VIAGTDENNTPIYFESNEITVTDTGMPGHVSVIDPVVPPTCTQPGKTAGEHCSVCNQVLVEPETIPALGHHEAVVPMVAPTSTEAGLTEGTHCSVCGEEIIGQRTIPALNDLDVLWLPSSLNEISAEAFANLPCQAVIIPEGCTIIGERAFAGCSNLLYVRIPSSVSAYPDSAFEGCGENCCIDWAAERLILSISANASSYNFAESAAITATITDQYGSTAGLEDRYPDARITATLLTADGEVVPGFIVQGQQGISMSCNFPFASDAMEPGCYMVKIETNVAGLSGTSPVFYYTADKSNLPDPSECSIELTLNTESFGIGETFRMTATVTDQSGNPVPGIKVGFMVLDLDGNYTTFFSPYDWLWNLTKENGACSIGAYLTEEETGEEEFTAGKYIARVFITDTDIMAEKQFEFVIAEQ